MQCEYFGLKWSQPEKGTDGDKKLTLSPLGLLDSSYSDFVLRVLNGCDSGVARCDADGDVTSNREECDNISDADCSSD